MEYKALPYLDENEVKDLHSTIKDSCPTVYEVLSKKGILDKQPFPSEILLLYYQKKLVRLNGERDWFEYEQMKKIDDDAINDITEEKAEQIKSELLNGVFHGGQNAAEINCLLGQTLKDVVINESEDRIVFVTESSKVYLMWHIQDCCESVYLADVCGDWDDLKGSPITLAEEVESNGEWPEGVEKKYEPESYTWTFYKIGTVNGVVTLRWYGESNGYYSEDVDFSQCFIRPDYNEIKRMKEYERFNAEISETIGKIITIRDMEKTETL